MSERRPGRGDEFYVNYMAVPAGLRRFLRLVTPMVLSLAAVVASGVAVLMRHPGDGRWGEEEVALEGVLLAEPWPVVRVERAGGGWETVLLVDYGKIGADGAVRQSGGVGRRVRVHGTVIERPGRRMVELSPRAGVIDVLGEAAEGDGEEAVFEVAVVGEMAIEGEIVDPKCYLGAMRPGVGEVHRACARVCIAGGIPAGLIVASEGGGERLLLLVDEGGAAVGARVLEWVGRPVRVTGRLERWGDVEVLRMGAGGVEGM